MAYRAAASVLLLSWINLFPAATRAQGMLPGCRLEDGSLQCVPGLTADPEKQINVLNQEISSDVQMEGQITQTIQGLKKFVLTGEAREGQILQAKFDLQADQINSVQIHWYQRQGDEHWKLVSDLSEETYRISQADQGKQVLAVMVVETSNGDVKRVSSNVIGPIQ
jgi:outer membrane biogenesis lipoprotein LolB